MTSHTPGPWILNGEVRRVGDTEHYCADICDPNDGGFWRGSIAYIQTADHLKHGMRIDEGKANAALIAAAPDLLAALQSLVPIIEEIHGKWDEGMRAGKLLIALMDASVKYRPDVTAIHAAIAKAEGRPS